jgi:hypothetical protein
MDITNDLPDAIRTYLDRDADDALGAFSPDAVVIDDGHTYQGTAEVQRFLAKAGSAYTFTTTLVGVERADDDHWTVTNHLSGDFPGGEVDLRYRFTLSGGLIAELVIAP